MHHPLTTRECRSVLLTLAMWAALTAACLLGTGCANQHRVTLLDAGKCNAAVLPMEEIEVVGNVSLFEPNPSHPLEINREK